MAGVVAAIGHTDATYDETLAGIEQGPRSRRTSATDVAAPPPGTRRIGVCLVVVVVCELIVDGHHLHPGLVLAASAESDGASLITDAISAAGAGDGRYVLGALESRSATASPDSPTAGRSPAAR